jgi:hypothetical protein
MTESHTKASDERDTREGGEPQTEHRSSPIRKRGAPLTQDPIAYRIAVGGVGLALTAFLIGAAIIAAGGNPVPTQYWSSGSATAGALLGILAPTPTNRDLDGEKNEVPAAIEAVLGDLWDNRGAALLLFVFVLSAILAAVRNSPELLAVPSAAGGALIGLLAPPPGQSGQ